MKIAAENSRIQIKMAIKQPILILFIFFSLLLLPSSTKILHPEELQESNIGETIEHGKFRGDHTGQYSLSRITTNRAAHGGSSGGSVGGGSVGGGSVGGSRGSSGDGSTSDSGKPYGAGSANINRHHHGASNRLQDSALLTWVIVIFAAQFTTQVL